jgi:hypothetical protein
MLKFKNLNKNHYLIQVKMRKIGQILGILLIMTQKIQTLTIWVKK